MKTKAPLLILALFGPVVIAELWGAIRPDDLESEIREWFASGRGQFESWLAERERENERD